MRPLELSLEGFTSFRSPQHLDFSQMDLFVITGPTGAGKSSILEAMTYALYGKTTRCGNQIGELVSQGAKNLKVTLGFAVGEDIYRIARSWRSRGKTTASTVVLEKRVDNSWETIEEKERSANKAVEDILGMDFDTFTRVILLPQGEFDEFLKGDTSKRREILRQLAGFEIFEQMRKQAGELSKLLEKERQAAERQLAELEVPPAWEVERAKLQITELENTIPKLQNAVWEAQQQLDAEERLFAQLEKLAQLEKQQRQLEAEAPKIAALEAKQQRAETAANLQPHWVLVREVLEQYQNATITVAATAEQAANTAAALVSAEQGLEKAKAAQTAATPGIMAREKAIATAQVLEEQRQQLVAEVSRSEQTARNSATAADTAKRQLKTAENKVIAAEEQANQAATKMQAVAPGGERLENLKQVMPLLAQWDFIAKQTQKNQSQAETADRELTVARQNSQLWRAKTLTVEIELTKCRDILKSAEAANLQAQLQNQAATLRSNLAAGDTCPVCGNICSDLHQLQLLPAPEMVDIAPLQARLETANRTYLDAQRRATLAEASVADAQRQQTDSQQELAAIKQRLEAAGQEISAILHQDKWECSALQGEYRLLQAREASWRQAQIEHQEALATLKQAQQSREFALQRWQEGELRHQEAAQVLQMRQQQLAELTAKVYEVTGGAAYETLKQALEREKQQLQAALEAATATESNRRAAAIQAETSATQAKIALDHIAAKKQQLETDWERELNVAGLSQEEFLTAQASGEERAAWQKVITAHREQSLQLVTRLEDLRENIGGRQTDAVILASRRAAKESSKTQFEQANQQKNELSVWVQLSETRLQQAADLQTQLETLLQQQEVYQTLAQNLKSTEFQSYILEHLEGELVARATLLLRELTDARYALEVEDGEYWVADNWNGGEKRRVRTLSGGETFAASVSMALALSEKLAMGAQLGSLFLDEGFGTLDVETLETVSQVLESLRQRSRVIGVITHITALADRAPTQIKVYKSPQGSHLEVETL
ncbi:MAG TPA: SMC family ATPase [Oscillatoriaceae cyanobacterium M33_DOE_052]|nr:SMC family ATPase [Oscillatoriaceae cyanobacterium M33_DOE_052]